MTAPKKTRQKKVELPATKLEVMRALAWPDEVTAERWPFVRPGVLAAARRHRKPYRVVLLHEDNPAVLAEMDEFRARIVALQEDA